eukprot:13668216-Ditylum_brightwellii.AAC.1
MLEITMCTSPRALSMWYCSCLFSATGAYGAGVSVKAGGASTGYIGENCGIIVITGGRVCMHTSYV